MKLCSAALLLLTAASLQAAPPTQAPTPAKPKAAAPQPGDAQEFTRLSKAVDAARVANKLDEAVQLYGQALRLRPKWPEGWWYVGTIFYDKDKFLEARDALRNVVALTPKMAPALALLGLCEFQTKEYDRAASHLDQARLNGIGSQDQLGASAMYHLSLLLTHFERYEQALDVVLNAAGTGDATPSYIAAAGLAALHKPIFPSDVPGDEREVVYLAGKAVLDTRARRVQLAQKGFEDLVAKYPRTPYVHYLYGSFLLVSEPDTGLKELVKELEISPHSIPALIQVSAEYLKRGELENALKASATAAESDPNSFAARGFYGKCLVENGEVNKGIVELEKAEQLAPDSPQIRVFLASAYAKAGRKEDAARERAEFQKLKELVRKPGEK